MLDDSDPLSDRDIAEYCRDVAAQLATMARDAGLITTASAFELAYNAANDVLQRNADPDEAA